MAAPDFILRGEADVDISALQRKLSTLGRSLNFNSPFAALSKDVGSFGRSLDNANQRVIAFASSITILGATVRVFRDIVRSTVEVEKAFVEINAVFGLTSSSLDRFSKDLFGVARDTAQSFAKTAEAAKEFSRQGLSAAETLKRTRDAMVLTRLASVDVSESVETLTAAINGFAKAGLNTTDVLNKLATVDAAFAVSAKDLAQGLARAGASAADAGVSFDQLIGLITSAQQTTARGGAVIGNALKSIFTRIERRETIDAFDALGVSVRDAQGAILPAIKLLDNFANQYDKLGDSVKKQAAELVGGVYQLNILKAVLNDVARANSVYDQATLTSGKATDQAIRRNEALNASLQSVSDQLKAVGTQVGSNIGNLTFAGPAKDALKLLANNPFTEALSDASGQAESYGGVAAQGFLKGIGNVLLYGLSPLIFNAVKNLTATTFGKLFGDITELSGVGRLGKENQAIQAQINAAYEAGGSALQRQLAAMTSLTQRAAHLQDILSRAQVSNVTRTSDIVSMAGVLQGRGYKPRAAGGFVPMGAESAAIARGVGGAPSGARPVYLPGFNRGGGQRGIVANTSEFIVPGAAGGAIFNRDMIAQYGLPPGSKPVAAGGYVPNAAGGGLFGPSELRPIPGTGGTFNIPRAELDSLNQMFVNLSRAAGTVRASGFAQQIVQFANALDRGSRGRVLGELATELRRAPAVGLIGSPLSKGPNVIGSVSFPSLYTAPPPGPYRSASNLEAANAALVGRYIPLSANASIASGANVFAANQSLSEQRLNTILRPSGVIGGSGSSAFGRTNPALANEAISGLGLALQQGPFREQILAPIYAKVEADRERREVRMEARLGDPMTNRSASAAIDARNQFFANSDARQRGIGFNRAVSRIESGQEITAAQNRLINDVYRQKGAELASKVFAPGASQAAVRGFVNSYLEAQIDKLNAAGNAALLRTSQPVNARLSLGERLRLAGNNPAARLGVGIGAPLLAGSIPEGRGGTAGGIAGSTAAGVLNLGALGFSFGGPKGAAIGVAIGGITGAASKLTESIEEVAKSVDEENKRLNEQLTAVSEVFRLEEEIRTLRDNGGSIANISRLKQAQNQNISRVRTPALRAIVSNPSLRSTPNALADAINISGEEQANNRVAGDTRFALANLRGTGSLNPTTPGFAFNSFRDDLTVNERENASAGISPALAKMTPQELDYFKKLAQTNPQAAATLVSALSGASATEIGKVAQPSGISDKGGMLSTQAKATLSTLAFPGLGLFGPAILGFGAKKVSDNSSDNTNKLLTQALLAAANETIPGGNAPGTPASTRPGELSFRDITSRISGFRQRGSFRQISSAANQRIDETNQRIALDSPALTDIDRLRKTGEFGRTNIQSQFGDQRASELQFGKADLSSLLISKKIYGKDAFNTVNRVGGLQDLVSLRRDVENGAGGTFGTTDTNELLAAIDKLIESMKNLNATEAAQIRVNDEINKLQVEELRFRKTYGGARRDYSGAARNAGVDLMTSLRRNDVPDTLLQRMATGNNTQIEDDYNAGRIDSRAYYGRKAGVVANTSAAQRINDARSIRYLLANPNARGAQDLTGGQISSGLMGGAVQDGLEGKSVKSFVGGFQSVFAGLKRDFADLSTLGQQLGDTLQRSLGDAFGDFVTGAKSGKDAFRSFAISVLGDASRMFASKAVQGVLSSITGFTPAGATGGEFTGSAFRFAAGGAVPALLTGGEYYIGPKAAKRIGYDTLRQLNRYAEGGMVRGGSGVKDDVPARLPPGSFIVRQSATRKLGSDYLNALVNGNVQNRWIGGALMGAAIGGGLGYATGGKKGAIGGAIVGGIAGGMYSYNAQGVRMDPATGQRAVLSMGTKTALGLGVAGGLGLLAAGLAPEDSKGYISNAQVPAFKAQLEREQAAEMGARGGKQVFLQINPQGGYSLAGYGEAPATRRWSEGGGVDIPMTPMRTPSSSSSSAPQVSIQIDINNNGTTTSSSSQSKDGGLPEGAGGRLEKVVRGWVQDEFVKADRPDGYFSQRGRFVNGGAGF